MNTKPQYIVRASDQTGYAPANHTGTTNVRLVSRDLNGAEKMEIILGDIAGGAGAPVHAHPDLEQAVYVLEGEALAGIDGEEHAVGPGDMMFFPANVHHSIRVVSDRLKILVIYAPPYEEDPTRRISQDPPERPD